jgi:hypothetical protein
VFDERIASFVVRWRFGRAVTISLGGRQLSRRRPTQLRQLLIQHNELFRVQRCEHQPHPHTGSGVDHNGTGLKASFRAGHAQPARPKHVLTRLWRCSRGAGWLVLPDVLSARAGNRLRGVFLCHWWPANGTIFAPHIGSALPSTNTLQCRRVRHADRTLRRILPAVALL